MNKVPVCIRPEYTMYLELFDKYLWFHIDVHKWSSEIKKKCQADFAQIQQLVSVPLFALIEETNTKLLKFAISNKWEKRGQQLLNNGSNAFIYASKRNTGE
ncbi:hypothetical protein UFOVP249_44 [uncultured Caudovirales phage]|uniref:Uncharacterized protein n=1 Tax=uncultured Caudovirales phage TaxID=2100421 RepID=A0A6J5LGZ0_9CAUD|nr:hypothetical protein UFOVP249_44 [uncultured Caudovirales phage]